jgi:hypothetical protein
VRVPAVIAQWSSAGWNARPAEWGVDGRFDAGPLARLSREQLSSWRRS